MYRHLVWFQLHTLISLIAVLFFSVLFCEVGFHWNVEAEMELVTSGNWATWVSQSAKFPGKSGSTRHILCDFFFHSKMRQPGTVAQGSLSFRRSENKGGRITRSCGFETCLTNMVKLSLTNKNTIWVGIRGSNLQSQHIECKGRRILRSQVRDWPRKTQLSLCPLINRQQQQQQ